MQTQARPLKQRSLKSFFSPARACKEGRDGTLDQDMGVDGASGQKGLSGPHPPTNLAVVNGQNGVAHVSGAAIHEGTRKRKQRKASAEDSGAIKVAASGELKAEEAGGQPQGGRGATTTADVQQSKKRKRKEYGAKPAVANGSESSCKDLPSERPVGLVAGGASAAVLALPKPGPLTERPAASDAAEGISRSFLPKPPSESPASPESFATARVATSDGFSGGSEPATLVTPPTVQQDGTDRKSMGERVESPPVGWTDTATMSHSQAMEAGGDEKPGCCLGASPSGLDSKLTCVEASAVCEGHLANSNAAIGDWSEAEQAEDVNGETKRAQLGLLSEPLEGPLDDGLQQFDKGNQRCSAPAEQAASPVRKGVRARKLSRKADELLQYSPEEARGVSGLGLRRRPEGGQEEGAGLQKEGRGARTELGVLDFGEQVTGMRPDGSLVELSRWAAELDEETSVVPELGEGDRPSGPGEGLRERKSERDRGERAANARQDAKMGEGDVPNSQGRRGKVKAEPEREQNGKKRQKEKKGMERRKKAEGAGEGASERGAEGGEQHDVAMFETDKEEGPKKDDPAKEKELEGGVDSQRGNRVRLLQTEGSGPSKQGNSNGLLETGGCAEADTEPDRSGGLTPLGKEQKIAELADVCLRASQSAESPAPSKKPQKRAPGTPKSERKPAVAGAGPVMKTCVNCGRTGPPTVGQYYGHPFSGEPCCAFCFHPTKKARRKAIEEGRDPDEAVRALLLDRKRRYKNGELETRKSRTQGSAQLPSSPVPPFTKAPRSPRKVVKPGGPVKLAWQSRFEAGGAISGGSPSVGVLESGGKRREAPPNGNSRIPASLGGASPRAKPAKSRPKRVAEQSQSEGKVASPGGTKRKKGPEAGSPQGKKRKLDSGIGSLKPVSPAKDAVAPGKGKGAKGTPKPVQTLSKSSRNANPSLLQTTQTLSKPSRKLPQSPQKSPLQKLLSRPPKTRPPMLKSPAKVEASSKRPKTKDRSAPAPPAVSHRLETPPTTPKAERLEASVKRPASRTISEILRDPYPVVPSAGGDDVRTSDVASGSGESLAAALAAFRERKRDEGVFHEMPLKNAPPKTLMGRKCKVYWPMDDTFYPGVVYQYNNQTGKHKILYEDGYEEVIHLADQRIQIQVFPERDPILVTDPGTEGEAGPRAANGGAKKKRKREQSSDGGTEGPEAELRRNGLPSEGDAVWGKVKGHAPWPCLVMNEEQAERVALEPGPRETAATTVPVQFFGTCEVGRLRGEQVETFQSGLDKGLHKKLKAGNFLQALQETEAYLRHRQLPPGMQAIFSPADDSSSGEEEQLPPSPRKPAPEPEPTPKPEPETPAKTPPKPPVKPAAPPPRLPIQCQAQLTVHALGMIVQSKNFHTSSHIFPVGFRSTRLFFSMKNPERRVSYTMEILAGNRNGAAAPLFRITPEDGPPMKGYDTRALWLDIAQQIGEVRERLGQAGGAPYFKSGPSMFGFSDVKIVPLIESLPNAREWCTNYAAWHDGHPPAHPNTPLSAKPKAPPLTAKAPSEPPPATYQPLNLTFRHDRCAVCYIEQDYDDNQLVQCDKCRVMVHMHCYGELEPPDGDLWLCQLCQEDALKEPPPCCLCPVVGGAMKPTNDGRWAHLTCAIWIPETLLKPHQIEKVDAIGKDRWKLRCSICRVKHGACIQCEDKSCKTAFHPLCARGRGLCMEVVTSKDVPATSYQRSRERGRTPLRGGKKSGETKGEEERNNEKRANKLAREGTDSERERRTERGAAQAQNHATSAGAKLRGDSEAPDVAGECSGAAEREEEEHDEEEDTLRLLAWCARHKPPEAGKAGRVLVRERRDAAGPSKVRAEDYVPPANPSGCARTEPFDPAARRGQRAPEAVATALAKRLFVRQVPYEITGRRHADRRPAPGAGSSKTLQTLDRRKAHAGPRAGLAAAGDALEAGPGLLGDGPKSATERYIMMKTTQGQRLAFGKSAIHGWGVFAKQRHAQASFVTEYAGEVVRQAVADAREKNLYNSIVGAGTYMFRIDDQRVVDATKAGSLAHLINHACEPNCFSRVVRADGDEHIVITAKRDILPGEEFTYDYRFNSKDEILTCNCGAPSCRGTVNFYDEDEGDEYGRVMAPVSEIKPWDPTKPMKGV